MRLISLNMERDLHLADQRRFFAAEDADILCLQEVHERDYEALRSAHGGHGTFAPMCLTRTRAGDFETQGTAIVSRHPLQATGHYGYRNDDVPPPRFEPGRTPQSVLKRTLVTVTLDSGLTVATTHFTWSPDAEPSDEQRTDMALLLDRLDGIRPLVLCGDFNAPRGGEIFAAIAGRYHDRIPARYTTSIDGDRHIAGPLALMIDGLFTTPDVEVAQVRLIDGVSDHMAVVAQLEVAARV